MNRFFNDSVRVPRVVAVAVALALVVAACGSGGEEEATIDPVTEPGIELPNPLSTAPSSSSPSSTSPPTGDETPDPAEDPPVEQVPINVIGWHPNGDQLIVRSAGLFDDTLEVSVRFIAGASNDLSVGLDLDNDQVTLTSPDGQELAATEIRGADRDLNLRYTEIADVVMVFPGPRSEQDLVLSVGQGNFASADETFGSQQFAVGPFSLSGPPNRLPEPLATRDQAQHANGTTLRLGGIVFTDSRIGARFTLTNGFADQGLTIEDASGTFLRDDLGNHYGFMPPSGDAGETDVPAGSAVSGVLSFAGQIDPGASSLSLFVNDRFGIDADFATAPRMVIEDIPVGGTAPAPAIGGDALPDLLPLDENIVHANGTQIRVGEISFQQDTITVPVNVTLNSDQMVLRDDLGNDYNIIPPPDNPELGIESGEGLQGEFVFSGQIAPDATMIRLITNPRFGIDADFTSNPQFRFGPYELTRSADPTTEAAAPVVFPVDDLSVIVAGALGASATEEIERIVSAFEGTDLGSSVILTLPEEILFDFDSDVLRPDAAGSVALLAEVLSFYEGEPVAVVGHTDSRGSDDYNQGLSERRADAVVAALTENHAIDADLLTAAGRGESEPVADNDNPDGSDNPEGRQANRRVEVIIETDRGLPGE